MCRAKLEGEKGAGAVMSKWWYGQKPVLCSVGLSVCDVAVFFYFIFL